MSEEARAIIPRKVDDTGNFLMIVKLIICLRLTKEMTDIFRKVNPKLTDLQNCCGKIVLAFAKITYQVVYDDNFCTINEFEKTVKFNILNHGH